MWYWLEKISLWLGLLLLTAFALSRWHAHWGYEQAMAQFEPVRLNAPGLPPQSVTLADTEPALPSTFPREPEPLAPLSVASDAPAAQSTEPAPSEPERLYLSQPLASLDPEAAPVRPEASLWSDSRRASYQEASAHAGAPVALLEIPAIALTVPVFDGTEEWQLNKGVGRVNNGAGLDGAGNLALAGHRDGFFRRLGELAPGDALWVTDAQGERRQFLVNHSVIVEPNEVWVLAPSAPSELTLITCYPFYFLGSAPQRYIVKAVRWSEPQP
ncbi:class D sortase [Ferrimonas balearica]|uniref:class D sortase n=1 Tax=Ferrimonas balearica TaxID=44012 RepID=UPI001F1BABAE|nr:class D sortase [Ferrimonas balearica]MBY6016852.1 class D sortase [Halomonas denitrificans]MBY6094857.1 class D sortase [Ferrimonas balearica]